MSRGRINICVLALASAVLPVTSIAPVASFAQTVDGNSTTTAPTSPPAQVCGNASVLNGPATQPAGSVRVDPGDLTLWNATQANPAGTTFWLAPGKFTLGANPYGQIIPKDGNAYIGAPGAVLDGQGVNYYAFTQKAANVR